MSGKVRRLFARKGHGGFGEGDGETDLLKGKKVRAVPTLRGGRLEKCCKRKRQ